MQKLVAFVANTLITVLTVLSPLLMFAAVSAEPQVSGWTSDGNPSLQKLVDLPPNQIPAFSNRDCEQLSYMTTSGRSGTDCFVNTALGLMASSGGEMLFNNTSQAVDLASYMSGNFTDWPIPNQSLTLAMSSGVAPGLYVHFYRDIRQAIQPNYTKNGTLLNYRITEGPDFSLRDNTAQQKLISANPRTIAFSSNGNWMIFDNYGVFLRVNLATFQITPFAPSLNGPNDYSSKSAATAISDDGRYVMIASNQYKFAKIYDLSVCVGSTDDSYGKILDCKSRDYWPYLAGQPMNVKAIQKVRFVNDDNIVVDVMYNWQDATRHFDAATFELTAPGASSHGMDYLALGDSYISGQGEFIYREGTDTSNNTCHLSSLSYPFILGADLFSRYQSIACSGAKTKDITGNGISNYDVNPRGAQATGKSSSSYDGEIYSNFLPGYRIQLQFVAKYHPKVVTLSIGGNDMGFSDIVSTCVLHVSTQLLPAPGQTCYDSYDDRLEIVEKIGTLFGTLKRTYQAIQAADPGVQLYVIGYPQVVVEGNCADNVHLNADEIQFSQQLIAYLDQTIEKAANSAGARYVDTQDALAGNRLCETKSSEVAVNGFTAGNDAGVGKAKFIGAESYHPNQLGHQMLARAVLKQTDNLAEPMPLPDPAVHRPEPTDPLAQELLANLKYDANPPKQLIPDEGIVQDLIVKGNSAPVAVDGQQDGLQPGGSYQAVLHSSPINLGTYVADSSGNLNFQITVPADTLPGIHILHIYGQNIAGQSVDIEKPVYIAASEADYNGDGVPNSQDQCLIVPLSGHDMDQDGVDDACDPVIGDTPLITVAQDISGPGNSDIDSNMPGADSPTQVASVAVGQDTAVGRQQSEASAEVLGVTTGQAANQFGDVTPYAGDTLTATAEPPAVWATVSGALGLFAVILLVCKLAKK